MVARRLRVLCLHGYRTNSRVMQDQTRPLRKALGPQAEFVYLDAPFVARGPAEEILEQRYKDHRPFYEWGHIIRLPRDLAVQDNGWYHQYVGFDTTVRFMDEQLRQHGPIDVAVGFSQGGQMITALTMYYLHHRKTSNWKCCLICCGTRVRDAGLRPLFEHPDGSGKKVPIPSIHLVGKTDKHYDTCKEHVELYEDHPAGAHHPKFVFEHDGGHRFPSGERHDELYAAIAEMMHSHCG